MNGPWLLSDFAGVLGQHQSRAAREAMARAAEADFDRFWAAYWAERDPYDAGAATKHDYWNRVAERSGTRWTDSAVERLDALDVESWLTPDEGTCAFTHRLAAAGVRLAVLSNAPLSLAAALHRLPWLGHFDRILCSGELGVTKPDARAYRAALDALEARPEDVVFLDDRPANVAGAEQVGIRSVVFSDAAAADREVSALFA